MTSSLHDPFFSRTCSILATALVTLTATTALAQDTMLYKTNDPTAPAMVVGPQGILFLHKDGAPYRSYEVKKGSELHITELDQDGKPDVIAIGKPTFVIGGDAAPRWFDKKGCKQGVLADIVADSKLDIACHDGKELKVLTFDNQFVWSVSIGKRLGQCYAGDTNGDRKADIECKIGSKTYARFDAEGKLISAEIDEPMIDQENPAYEPAQAADLSIIESKQTFDFDQDGTAEEYVALDDKLLVVKSKSRDKPLAMTEIDGELLGVLVQDVEGAEKKPQSAVIALTSKNLTVLSTDGKISKSYSLKSSSYKRKPVAELRSVYANGFEDNDAAKKVIEDLQEKLATCYATQLKKTELAGSGQMLIQLKVDGEGKLTDTELLHSEVADDKVASCAKKNLGKGAFPKAASDSASVNVTIYYTFRDQ